MVLTEEEAEVIREKNARRAAQIDQEASRASQNRKFEKKSKKGMKKSGLGTRRSVRTIRGGHVESNRKRH
jgi:hypothetical protein